jgi:hypothetical protein
MLASRRLRGWRSRQQVQLSALGQDLIPVLGNVRVQLRRDAVRAGRLRRFRREQRTTRGERLLEEIHDFRRGLRALAASGSPGALAELAPYAMIFGLPVPAAVGLAADTARTRQRRLPDVPWPSFARDWQQACERQFEHSRGTAHRPASRDFAHQWSAPTITATAATATDTADMTADTAPTGATAVTSAAGTQASETMPELNQVKGSAVVT